MGAEAERACVYLDPLFHRRRGGSKGHVGCRGPAFGGILCHRCLPAPPVLAAEKYGRVGFRPKCGVFLSAWPLCWSYPHALPFSVPGCWLSGFSGLAGLGGLSGDPRSCFPYFFCPCPHTAVPGALPFQSLLAQCLYCGVLCIWVGFFRYTVCACSSRQWGPA